MPTRRRKLSKDFERKISIAQKEIELILAKINDIDEDEIREEYMIAFVATKTIVEKISSYYKVSGYSEDIEAFYSKYSELLNDFKLNYEI